MNKAKRIAGIAGALTIAAGLLPGVARSAAVAAPVVPAVPSSPSAPSEPSAPSLPSTPSVPAAPPVWRAADDGARIVNSTWVNESTLELTVRSPAVARDVNVRILVPDGWQWNARRKWPTVYALAGGGGGDDQTTWTSQTDVATVAADWNVLVVMSYASPSGGFVDWYNNGAGGTPKWETYHLVELRQLIERNLGGGAERAVMGISSGGTAAITFAGRRPGMFRYAASFSGILHLTAAGVPVILMLTIALRNGEPDPGRIWGKPGDDDANWRAHDPYHLISKLRGTGLYVSGGTTGERGTLDPADLPPEKELENRLGGGLSEQLVGATSKDFIARARQLNVPVTEHMYGDGYHQWAYWQREMHYAWPQMMRALRATRNTGVAP